ncbi:hypothetical protein LJ360_03745 [Marinobacter sp. AN1]|nr:hypothetical protein [Marinobacter sp. AN1]UZD66477.1 hypothetical protein LJ360_03745 [Marinobacter sp. AN1]
MLRTLYTRDLNNHRRSELIVIEVTPTTFPGIVTRTGTAILRADKRRAFDYVYLD